MEEINHNRRLDNVTGMNLFFFTNSIQDGIFKEFSFIKEKSFNY